MGEGNIFKKKLQKHPLANSGEAANPIRRNGHNIPQTHEGGGGRGRYHPSSYREKGQGKRFFDEAISGGSVRFDLGPNLPVEANVEGGVLKTPVYSVNFPTTGLLRPAGKKRIVA